MAAADGCTAPPCIAFPLPRRWPAQHVLPCLHMLPPPLLPAPAAALHPPPPPLQELNPASQTARFEDLAVYRVGGGPKAPSSALPIGAPAAPLWPLAACCLRCALSLCCLPPPAQASSCPPHGFLPAASITPTAHPTPPYTHPAPTPCTTPRPAGATSVSDPLKLSRVTNPQDLLYTLLAVSHAPQPELLLSGACVSVGVCACWHLCMLACVRAHWACVRGPPVPAPRAAAASSPAAALDAAATCPPPTDSYCPLPAAFPCPPQSTWRGSFTCRAWTWPRARSPTCRPRQGRCLARCCWRAPSKSTWTDELAGQK